MFRWLERFSKRARKAPDRPLIFAHRGARKLAPENTLPAFEKAAKLGFDGVEMDVVITKDKVPIVFHGNNLARYTRSTGLVHEMPLEEIKKVDAGSLFDEKFAETRIPTLAEALEFLAGTNLQINIELKSQPRGHKGLEQRVAEQIYQSQLYDRILISSFSPLILNRFSKIAPKMPTALLVGPHPFFFLKTLLFANMLNIKALNPIFQDTSEVLMDFARLRDWRVFVWTINTRQEFTRACELGVDGIITDEPDMLKW